MRAYYLVDDANYVIAQLASSSRRAAENLASNCGLDGMLLTRREAIGAGITEDELDSAHRAERKIDYEARGDRFAAELFRNW